MKKKSVVFLRKSGVWKKFSPPFLPVAAKVGAPHQFFAERVGKQPAVVLHHVYGKRRLAQGDAVARVQLFGTTVEAHEKMSVPAFGYKAYFVVVVDD